MKELKFTPENLEKHLNSYKNKRSRRKIILTIRDEIKGKYGDLFHVEGLEHCFVLSSLSSFDGFCDLAHNFCKKYEEETGFEPDELLKEVIRLYPNAKTLYAHWLYECYDE